MSGVHNLTDLRERCGFSPPAPQSSVCLRNRDAQRSLSLSTCHIGRIVEYCELNGELYCVTNLFLRPEALPDKIDPESYKLEKFKEVVEHCLPNLRKFPVKDIFSLCEIISGDLSKSVESYLDEYKGSLPCYVLRFKLEGKGPDNFTIKPCCVLTDKKMVLARSDILSEKGLNSEGKGPAASGVKGLKSPKQFVKNTPVCHEEVKENVATKREEAVDHEESTCGSLRERRPSKATVRRSLVSALDSSPSKQPRLCEEAKASACKVVLDRVDTDSDTDSIFKDSWVSQLVDANIPIVDNGRCPTPIRLSLKRIRSDITPCKVSGNLNLRRQKHDDSDDDVGEDSGSTESAQSNRTRSSAVTPSRRSARKTKCAYSLAESDFEDVSPLKGRSARKNLNKTDAESQTPKSKVPATEPTGIRSSRRNSTWEAEESKTPKRNRAESRKTTSEAKPSSEGEVEDILSPLESRTPLSKRTRGKTPQPQGNSTEDPKTPTSRKRGKTPVPQEDDDSMMSPVESKTPLAFRTPNKTPKAERTNQKTPKGSSKTPSKSPKTPKAKPSTKTPSKSALTPSMPARATAPLTPMSSLEQIRKNLHVSAVPMSLPCRESEYRNIYNFLENKIRDAAGGCMYISGVPGTGKTATVNAVVRSLKKLVDSKKLRDFQYIETNGLRMTEPRQVFVQVLKALTGQKCAPQQAQDVLAERFCSGSAKNKTVVLLVDEVDMLRNRRQDVIYNLFDWPSKPNSRFIVLTIANTMDLPERLLKGRVTSRLGLTRLTFQPYSYKQLQEIVLSRLQGSNSFNDDAVELVARKVAACSGDVRRALDICRRASEMVEEGNPVTMPIVNQVLSQMMNSANVCSIKACSRLEKLFLQAIVAENERTGLEETNFISVYRQFQSFCALSSVTLINISEAMALLNRLGTSGLLLIEHARADINQSIFLNVNADDIHYALNQTAPAS